MPPLRQSDSAERLTEGWLVGITPRAPAHFYRNGMSLCHTWSSTIYDRPAERGRKRCEACEEIVNR